MIALRPYQSAMIDKARDLMRQNVRRVLMVAPTGAGKRLMAVHTIGRAVARGKRCWFLVHRKELLDQACRSLDEACVQFGVIQSGVRPDYRQPVQVASVQTMTGRLGMTKQAPIGSLRERQRSAAAELIEPDFIFADEAHHARAATWERILTGYPKAFVLGFTATPLRLDGRSLGHQFDRLVIGPSTRELIDGGFLADYRLFAPPGADLSNVRSQMGDYRPDDLAEAVDRPQIVGDVVAHYQRHANGTQAVCFGVNVQHSQHIAAAFAQAGISARHLDGTTSRNERSIIMDDFAAGRFRVLCNVDILGEGLDVAGIETVICARPTQSLSVYLQQIGRGLRVKPDGRRAIILDHAGNSLRHGLPDEPREWSLEDDPKRRKRASSAGVRICPACFAALVAQARICPECGFKFVIETEVPDHAEGELQVVDIQRARFQQRIEQGQAKSLEDLIELGRRRGYKSPRAWAEYVWGYRWSKKRSAGAAFL